MSVNRAEQGPVGLMAAVLRGVPRLDGALCVGARGRFWEAENGNKIRVRECIALCHQCPCLAQCRQLCEEMSYSQRKSRTGVWAGTYCGRPYSDDETTSETG